MVHVGKNTRSRIVSKGISAGRSQNAYRGLVQVCHASCSSILKSLSSRVHDTYLLTSDQQAANAALAILMHD